MWLFTEVSLKITKFSYSHVLLLLPETNTILPKPGISFYYVYRDDKIPTLVSVFTQIGN